MYRVGAPRSNKCWSLTAALLAALFLGMSSAAMAAEFEVIASKSVSTGSLSKGDAQAIFLGDKAKWDDGKNIVLAVLEEGGAHTAFLQDVVSKTPSQFDSYWKRLVFAGKAAAPKSFSDAGKLVEFVAATPGAVGYVPAGKADGSVKTISIK